MYPRVVKELVQGHIARKNQYQGVSPWDVHLVSGKGESGILRCHDWNSLCLWEKVDQKAAFMLSFLGMARR